MAKIKILITDGEYESECERENVVYALDDYEFIDLSVTGRMYASSIKRKIEKLKISHPNQYKIITKLIRDYKKLSRKSPLNFVRFCYACYELLTPVGKRKIMLFSPELVGMRNLQRIVGIIKKSSRQKDVMIWTDSPLFVDNFHIHNIKFFSKGESYDLIDKDFINWTNVESKPWVEDMDTIGELWERGIISSIIQIKNDKY